jgi:PAS domain S-box-containing protein
MVISLGTNMVTTGLLLHRQAMDSRMICSERRYEEMLNALAVAIWEVDFQPVANAIAAVRAAGVDDLPAYLDSHPAFVSAAQALVRITDVNETALGLMGLSSKDAFFGHIGDFLPETDRNFRDWILAIDERRDMHQSETQVIDAAGERIDVIVAFSFSPDRSLERVPGSILDIRQRKRLETMIERTRHELDKVHRSAAIGAMSATIAHEINQPLAAIQGFARSASRWLDREKPELGEVRQSLAGLDQAMANVYEVMQRIRNLVGSARGEAAPVDLHALIAETVAFAGREADAQSAKLLFTPSVSDAMILGDRLLLKHLLLNLITNALQAMAETAGEKRVEIRLDTEGSSFSVAVRDYGPGFTAPASERPFDPFFTTKPGGMGLGLSICRSIVELHDGRIMLANHPEGGAIASLTFSRQEQFA